MFRSKLNLRESFGAIKFHVRLLVREPLLLFSLITSGVLVRFMTVFVFVLIFKVFLTIIDPNVSLVVVNKFLYDILGRIISASEFQLALILTLLFMICVQFLLNKLYLRQYLNLRSAITSWLLKKNLNDHQSMHLHICLDKFPQGFEGIVKSAEILVFYFFLLIGIFFINVLAGFLVVIVVPLMIALMLIKSRKEIHVQKEMQDARRRALEHESEIETVLSLARESYAFARNGITYAEFFGGLAIVTMMSVLLFSYAIDDGISEKIAGLAALLLVFCMRFAVVYAGELSRSLGKVLQQRVIIENISNFPFDGN